MHGMTSGSPLDTDSETRLVQWFVMRDLTRSNAKLPAYLLLAGEGIECFTPMVPKLRICQGKRERVEAPFIHDLLFVHSSREVLDPFVERIQTFQYRYLRKPWRKPMTVRTEEMERFIRAVGSPGITVRMKSPLTCAAGKYGLSAGSSKDMRGIYCPSEVPGANACWWNFPDCWLPRWKWNRNTSSC